MTIVFEINEGRAGDKGGRGKKRKRNIREEGEERGKKPCTFPIKTLATQQALVISEICGQPRPSNSKEFE